MAQKNKAFSIVIVIFLVLAAVGAYVFTQAPNVSEIIPDDETEVSDYTPPEADGEQLQEREVGVEELTDANAAVATIDHQVALTDRILGDENAPIRIAEFASFSCGHCGNFHNKVFKQFKENWIDTGRAYFVFSDFPLNAPALYATVATRCIADDEDYFAAVSELFEKQSDWAYQSDYFTPLKEIVTKHGLTADEFQSCVRDEKLQEALLDKVRANQQQFGVSSTPSFVINNDILISGSAEYEVFNKTLEEAIAGGGDESP